MFTGIYKPDSNPKEKFCHIFSTIELTSSMQHTPDTSLFDFTSIHHRFEDQIQTVFRSSIFYFIDLLNLNVIFN